MENKDKRIEYLREILKDKLYHKTIIVTNFGDAVIDEVIKTAIEYGESLAMERAVKAVEAEIKGMTYFNGMCGVYTNSGGATKEKAYKDVIKIIQSLNKEA